MSTNQHQAAVRAANERAITDTCALAGKPERAAAFIAAGTNARTVLSRVACRAADSRRFAGRLGRTAVAQVNRDHLARAGGR